MKDIKKRLKEARIKAEFNTATEAAEALGIPYQTYATHENGSGGVPLHAAIKYARKFRVSLDWLVTGKGKGPENADAWEIFLLISDVKLTPEDVRYLKNSVEYVKKSSKAA